MVSGKKEEPKGVKRLVLPLPPSANLYWRAIGIWGKDKEGKRVPRAKVILSREGRAYKERAELLGKAQAKGLMDGPVEVWLTVYFPNRRGDLDNRVKPTLDAIQGVAILNDSQVEAYHVMRRVDAECPRVEIKISRYAG